MPPKILVISGPTASGKTRLAVELALRHGGEVVSADSMQVYRRMDIGTAKPTPEEMRGIPHHMLDVADPEEDFSVARYVELAAPCVDDILARGKLPIVAGGTGLYLDSLLSGRTFAPFSPDGGLRARLEARFDALGGGAMLGELAAADPEAAARLHPNDRKRIVRALEVFQQTGKTISQHNRETRALSPRYDALTLSLAFQRREDMWARIDRRVDEMMAAGLARRSGPSWTPVSRCGAPPCRPSATRRWLPLCGRAERWLRPRRRLSSAPGSTPSGSSPGSGAIRRPTGCSGRKIQILGTPDSVRRNFWRNLG